MKRINFEIWQSMGSDGKNSSTQFIHGSYVAQTQTRYQNNDAQFELKDTWTNIRWTDKL